MTSEGEMLHESQETCSGWEDGIQHMECNEIGGIVRENGVHREFAVVENLSNRV